MTKEVVHALVALISRIAVHAATFRLHRVGVEITFVLPSKRVATGLSIGTLALAARHLVGVFRTLRPGRSAVESNLAGVTEISHGRIPTVDTIPCQWFTNICVSVTLALLTVGKVPVAGLALVTPPPEGWLFCVARALSRLLVTELILAARTVALAADTTRAGEAIGGRGTGVTASTDHKVLAAAATVVLVAHSLCGAGLVAVALAQVSALEGQERD